MRQWIKVIYMNIRFLGFPTPQEIEILKEILKSTPTIERLVHDRHISFALIADSTEEDLKKLEATFSSCAYENMILFSNYAFSWPLSKIHLNPLTNLDHELTIRLLASLSHPNIVKAFECSPQADEFIQKLQCLHQRHSLNDILEIISVLSAHSASLNILDFKHYNYSDLDTDSYFTTEVIENYFLTLEHPIISKLHENSRNTYKDRFGQPSEQLRYFILRICKLKKERIFIDALSDENVLEAINVYGLDLILILPFYQLLQYPKTFAMLQYQMWGVKDITSYAPVESFKKVFAIRNIDLSYLGSQFDDNKKLINSILCLDSKIRSNPTSLQISLEDVEIAINDEFFDLNRSMASILEKHSNDVNEKLLVEINRILNKSLMLSKIFFEQDLQIIPILQAYADFLFKHEQVSQAFSLIHHSHALLKQPNYALEVAERLMFSSPLFAADPLDRHRFIFLLLKDVSDDTRANMLKCQSLYVLQKNTIMATSTEQHLQKLLDVDLVLSFEQAFKLTIELIKKVIHRLERDRGLIPIHLVDLYYQVLELTFYTPEAFHALIATIHSLSSEYAAYLECDIQQLQSLLQAKKIVAHEQLLLAPTAFTVVDVKDFGQLSPILEEIKILSLDYQNAKYQDHYGKLSTDLLGKLHLYMKSYCLLELLGDNRNTDAKILNLLSMETLNELLEDYNPELQLEILVRTFQEIMLNNSLYGEPQSFNWQQNLTIWKTGGNFMFVTPELKLHHIALLKEKAQSILQTNNLSPTDNLQTLLGFRLSYLEDNSSSGSVSFRRQKK